MFDFETALKVGMAFRFDITADAGAGGVRPHRRPRRAAGRQLVEARKNLEALLEGHLHSRAGLELLPQGTATNNTEAASTGFNVHGDPTSGFTAFFKEQPLYAPEADPLLRRDGQWFAETLGVKEALAQRIPNAERARSDRGAGDAPGPLAGHARLHDAHDAGAGLRRGRHRRHPATSSRAT